MTHRERILAALECRDTDIVPFDLGGTKVTSMNPHAERTLKKFLGLEREEVWGSYRFQRMHMPEELSLFFDSDVRRVGEDFPRPLTPEITAAVQTDEFGVTWNQTDGGLFMPSIKNPPLGSAESGEELKNYPWPDPHSWQQTDVFARKAEKYHQETDYAVCIDLPDCVVQYAQYLRGTEQWMMDLVMNKKFISLLMGYIADIYIEMVRSVLKAVGNNADFVVIPDDMGGQNGLLMSPDTYREMIKPHHQKIFDTVHSVSNAKIVLHSCGSNYPLIGDYIDMGVQGLNPVQVSAAGMDTETLNRDFGGKICFWGGIDTQNLLPNGSPAQVKEYVKKRIDDFSHGGYVVSSVHVIQAGVPPENILALAEAAHLYGGRSTGERFYPRNAEMAFAGK